MKSQELMPWAQDEIFRWAMDTHLRECTAAGATPQALEHMEAKLTELGVGDDDEIVEFRREIVSRFARNRSQIGKKVN